MLEAAEIRDFLEAELELRSPEWLRNAFTHADAVCRLRATQLIAASTRSCSLSIDVFGKALAA